MIYKLLKKGFKTVADPLHILHIAEAFLASVQPKTNKQLWWRERNEVIIQQFRLLVLLRQLPRNFKFHKNVVEEFFEPIAKCAIFRRHLPQSFRTNILSVLAGPLSAVATWKIAAILLITCPILTRLPLVLFAEFVLFRRKTAKNLSSRIPTATMDFPIWQTATKINLAIKSFGKQNQKINYKLLKKRFQNRCRSSPHCRSRNRRSIPCVGAT